MRFSSMSMPFRRATSEPVAMTMFFVSSVCDDAAGAAERFDLVLLEQKIDALDVTFDVLLLVFEQHRQIDARLGDLDPHFRKAVAGLLIELGSVQHRLRGDATDVEAGAAEGGILLDDGGFQPELCRAYGADIAARAGANDNEVVGH